MTCFFKKGDKVIFDISRNVGGAVYGRDGEMINRLDEADRIQRGTIVDISTTEWNVTKLQIKSGNKVINFYPDFMGEHYWIKRAEISVIEKKDEFQEYMEQQLIKSLEDNLPVGSWVAHKKGGPEQSSFEISVIRKGYKLGFDSWGWFEKDKKLLVTHNGGPCTWPLTKEIWDACWKVAQAEADRLNREESKRGPRIC